MAGSSDEQLLARLGAAFKIHYDADGWRQAELFPGVMDLLEYLQRLQIPLYLATNKRMVPTSRIMRHLGLAQFFCAMYSLDSVSPAAPDKASLLGRLLQECRLSCSDAWYVGDRVEDAEAARSNEMPFAAAVWGYGAWTGGETQLLRRLEAPGAMIGLLHG
jgi:phosphoglycolate phosphatase